MMRSPPSDFRFSWVARLCRQEDLRRSYTDSRVQWAIAGLIMGNFTTNIVEKQIDPTGLKYEPEWKVIENVWNSIFVVELAWNMSAHWALTTWSWRETSPPYKMKVKHFLCSSWNLFDFLVVGVSVPSLLGIDLGSFSQLRMLRAFRVFRLFKRIKSLNRIIVSLANAVPGLINAAIVQFLVMCIYAILAVDLFRDFGKEGEYINIAGETVPVLTARGMTFGDEYYGNFFRSLYTLFQVLTGESWSEAVARPVIMERGVNQYVGGIYFVSYIIVCGIILVNVSVAVLLEKMVALPDKNDDDDDADQGIILADLPEHAQIILAPLDTDGDGVLSQAELLRAADLLKREQFMAANEMEDPSFQARKIAKELADQMKKAEQSFHMSRHGRFGSRGRLDDDDDDDGAGEGRMGAEVLEELREDGRRREQQLNEHLEEGRRRQEAMEAQLAGLMQTVQGMQGAILQRMRRKRPPPRSGSERIPFDDEDKVQDGERTGTKQAPPQRVRSSAHVATPRVTLDDSSLST